VSRPQLSIVLPTRDRPAELDATLSGVTRQLDTADRLLVVDSASRGPAAVAEVARRHGADVLRMEQPGAARARNAGWQAVGTEIVVFVDDTLVVADGWLDALVAPLADDPGRGFVSGRIDPVGGREGSKPIAVHRAGAARPVEAGDPAPGTPPPTTSSCSTASCSPVGPAGTSRPPAPDHHSRKVAGRSRARCGTTAKPAAAGSRCSPVVTAPSPGRSRPRCFPRSVDDRAWRTLRGPTVTGPVLPRRRDARRCSRWSAPQAPSRVSQPDC
jgi:hypothetical protein